MIRLREHVDGCDGADVIAFCVQILQIPLQCARVAGDIDDLLRLHFVIFLALSDAHRPI